MADSKRKKAGREKVDSAKAYLVDEALDLVKSWQPPNSPRVLMLP